MSHGTKLRLATLALISGGSALIAGCATETTAPADMDLSEDGRAIVSSRCATCHAVGADGASPNPSAPPLRTVFDRTYRNRLAEQFRNGLRVGHDEMPVFEFSDEEINAVMAYLQEIEE